LKPDSLLECLVEGDRGGDMRVFELIEYVGCWHETDMPTAVRDVRYQEQSEKHLLTVSSSQFDPKPNIGTSPLHCHSRLRHEVLICSSHRRDP
jgi:hypothetical protein